MKEFLGDTVSANLGIVNLYKCVKLLVYLENLIL